MKKLSILTTVLLSTSGILTACSTFNTNPVQTLQVVAQDTVESADTKPLTKLTNQKLSHLLVFTAKHQPADAITNDDTTTNSEKDDDTPISYKGVMDTTGKIIVPAEYTSIDVYTFSRKGLQIIATGKKDYTNKYIADIYDMTGKLLDKGIQSPLMRGFPPRIISLQLNPNANFKEIMGTVKQELQQRNITDRDEQREYFKQEIEPKTLELYDYTTGHRADVAGKNIRRLGNITKNHVEQGLFPAKHMKNFMYGFIDNNADWIIAPQYRRVVDTNRQILPPNTFAVVELIRDKRRPSCYSLLMLNTELDKRLDTTLDMTIDTELLGKFSHFDSFQKSDFDNKYYAMADSCDGEYHDPQGLLNEIGEWAIAPQKEIKLLTHPNSRGFITFNNTKTDTIGVIDIAGNIVIPAQYYRPRISKQIIWQNSHPDMPNLNKQGLFAVSKERDSEYYGFINIQNEWIIPPTLPTSSYNSYAFNADGHAYSYINDSKGLRIINTNGKDVYPHIKGSISQFNEQGFAPFKDLGKMGVINKKGDIILQPTYNSSKRKLYKHNTACIKQTLADVEHTKPLPESTDNHVKKKYLCGVIDSTGTTVIPPLYKEVDIFEDFAIVETHDNRYGVLDYHNNWLIKQRSTPIKQLVTAHDITFKAIYRP